MNKQSNAKISKRARKRMLAALLAVSVLITTGCGLAEKEERDDPREVLQQQMAYYEPDPEGDDDGDGLLNKEETELGTDLFAADTDGDGLTDETEVNSLMTDPLLYDTDEDKLSDGVEWEMGLDPLKKRSNGWTADRKRDFTKTYEVEGCKLEVEGNARVADIYVDTLDYCGISNTPGVASELYEFYMQDMEFDNATLTLSYDKEAVEAKGYDEDSLAIFQFLDDGTFKEVGGTIDTKNGTVTVELEHFSKYVIADKRLIKEEYPSNVFILLDNSGSMYSPKECPGSDGNDIDFKRVDMAKQLIEMTGDKVHYGLAKFTADYMELQGGFENSVEELNASLDAIKTAGEKFTGTKIEEAVMGALDNYGAEEAASRKFILLLTDGESIKSSVDVETVIQEAVNKNVCIIAIGLGHAVNDANLTRLAKETGGFYIFANDADALDKVYETITTKMNYNYVDLDGDGKNDSILYADSGFDVTKDGFNFFNYCLEPDNKEIITNGQCYGMAMFSQLYYKGKLPLKGEAVPNHLIGGLVASLKGEYYECSEYDLTGVEFFANEGSEYASTKNDLYDYELSKAWYTYGNTPKNNLGLICETHPSNDRYIIFDSDKIDVKESALLQTGVSKVEHPDYDMIQNFYFTLRANYEELSEQDKDRYDVLKAIYNLYVQQDSDSVVTYDAFVLSFGDQYRQQESLTPYTSGVEFYEKERHFEELITYLNNGIVPVLQGQEHAVNAIRLYRDIEDPNRYTLVIYNTNYPGKEQYMEIVREKTLSVKDPYNKYIYQIYDTEDAFMQGFGKKLILSYDVHSSLVSE